MVRNMDEFFDSVENTILKTKRARAISVTIWLSLLLPLCIYQGFIGIVMFLLITVLGIVLLFITVILVIALSSIIKEIHDWINSGEQ